MDLASIIGIAGAFVLVIIGILWGGGSLISFVDPASIVITFGGTAISLFASFSFKDLSQFGKIIGKAFKMESFNNVQGINTIVGLANIARKEGMLALEENVAGLDEPFLKKGIMLIVDGTDPELVKSIMEAEIGSLEGRHGKGIGMVDQVGSMGPAFGMLGTLIGLVIMLGNLSDPSSLGGGMAAALITTFYGSYLANAFAIPLAAKLKNKSGVEIMYKEILLEGMLSIQAGENPRIIEEKLYSFLPPSAKGAEGGASEDDRGGGDE